MAENIRITDPLLDVIDILIDAEEELHGWEIMKRTRRSGPTVYQVLERLRKHKMVNSHWEDLTDRRTVQDLVAESSDEAEPKERRRRRFYQLNPDGMAWARTVLAERRQGRRLKDIFGPMPGLAGGAA